MFRPSNALPEPRSAATLCSKYYGKCLDHRMPSQSLDPPRHYVQIRGLVGSHFCTARCRETVWAAGPFTAGGGTARPCRLDGDMAALRLLVAVKDRRKTRKALEREWSHRRERLVNQRRSASRTGEVDEKSRRLGLPATTHLACTSGKHLSELEPALSPLLTLSC